MIATRTRPGEADAIEDETTIPDLLRSVPGLPAGALQGLDHGAAIVGLDEVLDLVGEREGAHAQVVGHDPLLRQPVDRLEHTVVLGRERVPTPGRVVSLDEDGRGGDDRRARDTRRSA